MKISVNAVAFQDDGLWIAQCLEYDIAASSSSINGLRHALEKSIACNMFVNMELGRNGLEGIPPAPKQFYDMFEHADEKLEPAEDDAPSMSVAIAAMRLAELEPLGDC